MVFHLKKVDSRKLTVKELEALEDRDVVNGERPLKPQRLKWMRQLFIDHEFSRCEWAVCHCKESGRWYRVNGQHSSHMLRRILDGKEGEEVGDFPEGIPLTVQHWECDTEEDLIDVFDQFDVKDSSRTNDEKLNQYAAMHTDLVGVDRKFINKILAGVMWFRKEAKGQCPEEILSIDISNAYHRGRLLNIDLVRDFVNFLHDRKDATFVEWQNKAGIVARLFLTFVNNGDESEILIDNLVYEADDLAQSYAKKVRASCARTGKDSGHFWKAADRYFRDMAKILEEPDAKEQIKKLIQEVLDESTEEELEPVH